MEYEPIKKQGESPSPVFFGDTFDTPMGVELEVEFKTGTGKRNAAFEVDGFPGISVIKEDETLDVGFEINVHPHSYDFHRGLFKWEELCRTLIRHKAYISHPNAGIHIHLEKKSLPIKIHRVRLAMFINSNKSLVEFIARRPAEKWCKFRTIPNGFGIRGIDENEFDRCEAINWKKERTIELRSFASCLNAKVIMCYIEFVRSIVDYIHIFKLKDMNNVNKYNIFISDYKDFYPNLYKRLEHFKEV